MSIILSSRKTGEAGTKHQIQLLPNASFLPRAYIIHTTIIKAEEVGNSNSLAIIHLEISLTKVVSLVRVDIMRES